MDLLGVDGCGCGGCGEQPVKIKDERASASVAALNREKPFLFIVSPSLRKIESAGRSNLH
jgi:hypothetical protein